MGDKYVQPYVEIIEQPANRAIRFLYESEVRKHYSIPGVHSTIQTKTYPTIRIVGKKGRARVVISCVTKDPPYMPHPYSVLNNHECNNGVCIIEIPESSTIVSFPDLGIQCIKKGTVEQVLQMRQDLHIDPFKTGHAAKQTDIDYSVLRLCFQVFLEGSKRGTFNVALPPVASDPIYDKRSMPDLAIRELCECTAPVAGGKRMILLCERMIKDDIQIRFFEEKDGELFWEGYGEFRPTHIHKRTAISFKTPRYYTQEVEKPVHVFVELRRLADGSTSEPVPFQMLPIGADDESSLKRKRRKYNKAGEAIFSDLSKYLKFEKRKCKVANNMAASIEDNAEWTRAENPSGRAQNYAQYTKTHLHTHSDAGIQRPQVAPQQMPSIIEDDAYNLFQRQYEQGIQPIMKQPDMPATIDPSSYVSNQLQSDQSENRAFGSEINLLISNESTPRDQDGLHLINNTPNQSSRVSLEQMSSMQRGIYNSSFKQYRSSIETIMEQSHVSAITDIQLPSYVSEQPPPFCQGEQNLLILNKEAMENQEELQLVNNNSAECLLNMDSKQIDVNSNCSDFMNSGRSLSKSLSGLSLSDAR